MDLPALRGRRRRAPAQAFLASLLAGEADEARKITHAYLASSGTRLAVIVDLFHSAQYEVGELWYQGRIGVADEHRATSILEGVAASLPATPVTPPGTGRCLLACLSGERHVLGLRLLSMALEDAGWNVLQLLGPTPVDELLRIVDQERPLAVGLSAW